MNACMKINTIVWNFVDCCHLEEISFTLSQSIEWNWTHDWVSEWFYACMDRVYGQSVWTEWLMWQCPPCGPGGSHGWGSWRRKGQRGRGGGGRPSVTETWSQWQCAQTSRACNIKQVCSGVKLFENRGTAWSRPIRTDILVFSGMLNVADGNLRNTADRIHIL